MISSRRQELEDLERAFREKEAQIDLVVEQPNSAITRIQMKYTDKSFIIGKRYAANSN